MQLDNSPVRIDAPAFVRNRLPAATPALSLSVGAATATTAATLDLTGSALQTLLEALQPDTPYDGPPAFSASEAKAAAQKIIELFDRYACTPPDDKVPSTSDTAPDQSTGFEIRPNPATTFARIPIRELPELVGLTLIQAPIADDVRSALALGWLNLPPDTAPTELLDVAAPQLLDLIALLGLFLQQGQQEPIPQPPLEIRIGQRWYAIDPQIVQQTTPFDGRVLLLRATLEFGPRVYSTTLAVVKAAEFIDPFGAPTPLTLRALFDKFQLRPASAAAITEQRQALVQARDLSQRMGTVLAVSGTGHAFEHHSNAIQRMEFHLGGEFHQPRAVVDAELEFDAEHNYQGVAMIPSPTGRRPPCPLPMVRAFALDLKKWLYFDVRDVTPYPFDPHAIDRLVLNDTVKQILRAICDQATPDTPGDIVRSKHGGFVILAHGQPGTGKTLTAETFAEYRCAPLYVLTLHELSSANESLESRLHLVFRRAYRWNAVLLIDEADILLARRNVDELARSAIVGIFLHMLDQFAGLLFLTTNRPEVLDPALLSRCTLPVRYPTLTATERHTIWRQLLERAQLPHTPEICERMAQHPFNGREIRNAVRLLKAGLGAEATHAPIDRWAAVLATMHTDLP